MEEGNQRNSFKRERIPSSSSVSGDKVDHQTKRQKHAAQFVDLTGDTMNDNTDNICISLIEIKPMSESSNSIVKEEPSDVIHLDTLSDHVEMRNQNELDPSLIVIKPEESSTVYSVNRNETKTTVSNVVMKDYGLKTRFSRSTATTLAENRKKTVTATPQSHVQVAYSKSVSKAPGSQYPNSRYGNDIQHYRPPIISVNRNKTIATVVDVIKKENDLEKGFSRSTTNTEKREKTETAAPQCPLHSVDSKESSVFTGNRYITNTSMSNVIKKENDLETGFLRSTATAPTENSKKTVTATFQFGVHSQEPSTVFSVNRNKTNASVSNVIKKENDLDTGFSRSTTNKLAENRGKTVTAASQASAHVADSKSACKAPGIQYPNSRSGNTMQNYRPPVISVNRNKTTATVVDVIKKENDLEIGFSRSTANKLAENRGKTATVASRSNAQVVDCQESSSVFPVNRNKTSTAVSTVVKKENDLETGLSKSTATAPAENRKKTVTASQSNAQVVDCQESSTVFSVNRNKTSTAVSTVVKKENDLETGLSKSTATAPAENRKKTVTASQSNAQVVDRQESSAVFSVNRNKTSTAVSTVVKKENDLETGLSKSTATAPAENRKKTVTATLQSHIQVADSKSVSKAPGSPYPYSRSSNTMQNYRRPVRPEVKGPIVQYGYNETIWNYRPQFPQHNHPVHNPSLHDPYKNYDMWHDRMYDTWEPYENNFCAPFRFENHLPPNNILRRQEIRTRQALQHSKHKQATESSTPATLGESQGHVDRIMRTWTNVDKEPSASENSKVFTIASYNVLAQNLLDQHMDLYRKCNREHLHWRYRSEGLIEEIKSLMPDILCLQEVNTYHYRNFFQQKLRELGYESAHKKRTGDKEDGCATFYLKDKLYLRKSKKVEYCKPNAYPLDRDNVALLTKFCFKASPKEYLNVANTHLLYNPKRGDIKLGQMMILLSEIEQFCYQNFCNPESPLYEPVILCGDFNSQPFSHLYNLVQKGSLNYLGLPCANISGQDCDRRGSSSLLGAHFIPMSVGISDQCQFFDTVNKRLQRLESHRITRETKGKRSVRNSDVIDGVKNPGAGLAAGVSQKTGKKAIKCNCTSCRDLRTESNKDEKCTCCAKVLVASQEVPKPIDPHLCTKAERDMAEIAERLGQQMSMEKSESSGSWSSGEQKKCSFGSGVLQHDLKLSSVYEHSMARGNNFFNFEVTTHHGKTSCTVDYIFHTKDNEKCPNTLVLESRYDLPTFEDMQHHHLPNSQFNSDHVILMARFRFIFQADEKGKMNEKKKKNIFTK